MSNPIRFHLDENIPNAVADGLRRLGIDVTTTQDARLLGRIDLEHIAFALEQRRVVVTQDADFLRHARQGISHCGIAYCRLGSRTIGEMVEMLHLMVEVMSVGEMRGTIQYI